jgi:hypothetical protein
MKITEKHIKLFDLAKAEKVLDIYNLADVALKGNIQLEKDKIIASKDAGIK